jgi:hypothetical protein
MKNIIPPREEKKYPVSGYLFVPAFGIDLLFKDKNKKQ